jgi:hypothetical protein
LNAGGEREKIAALTRHHPVAENINETRVAWRV